MGQVALPNSDVSDSGWTPQPVYQQINEAVPDDQTYVISAGSPGGDTFKVALSAVAWPGPGTSQLTVRLCKTDTGNLPVTVQLIQGDNTVIATRVLSPTQSFADNVISLTASEIASITDYTKLRVLVSTAPPPIIRRSLGTQGDSSSGTTLTLPSVSVMAGEMLIVCAGALDASVASVTFNGSPLSTAVTAGNAGIYYLPVTHNITGDVVVTWAASATKRCLAAIAVAGLPNNVLDKTASGSGSGTLANSGNTATTTSAKEYLQGLIFISLNPPGSFGITWGNGFNGGQLQYATATAPLVELSEGYQIVSATGNYAAEGTISWTANWVALLATFK